MSGPSDHLERGDWNVLCQRCGRKLKAHDLAKEWTGLWVCTDGCFEERHPQDFVRGIPDRQATPFSSPESADTFVSVLTWDEATGTFV